MAEVSGQTTIRGIDIDKLAKGFADEENVFKKYLTVNNTSAREIRWYQKTSGFLNSPNTTGITTTQLAGLSQLAVPTVVEQSWTRMTSYVRKFFAESPWISTEDIMDSDVDVLGTNIRDITRAVENQVDARIYSTLSGSLVLSGSAMGLWSSATANPALDAVSGSANIRSQGYDISNLALLMHPNEYKNLVAWVIAKGSQIPNFASEKVVNGSIMEIVGNKVVVSNNCTQGIVVQIVPNRVATWKQFSPITAQSKDEVGIGTKFRCWEEGEVLLTDPNAGFVIKGC